MLFINNDKPQVRKRGKQGGASSYHNMNPALANEIPLIVALACRQAGVQDRNILTKATAKPADSLGCKGYLRNKD